jgi:hypothetical protein
LSSESEDDGARQQDQGDEALEEEDEFERMFKGAKGRRRPAFLLEVLAHTG